MRLASGTYYVRDSFVPQIGRGPIGATRTSPFRRRIYHIEGSTDSTKTTNRTITNSASASPTCRRHFVFPKQKPAPPTTPSALATPSSGRSSQEQHGTHISKQAAEAGRHKKPSSRSTSTTDIRPTPLFSPTPKRVSSTHRTQRSLVSPSTSSTPELPHLPALADPDHRERQEEPEGSRTPRRAHCPSRSKPTRKKMISLEQPEVTTRILFTSNSLTATSRHSSSAETHKEVREEPCMFTPSMTRHLVRRLSHFMQHVPGHAEIVTPHEVS